MILSKTAKRTVISEDTEKSMDVLKTDIFESSAVYTCDFPIIIEINEFDICRDIRSYVSLILCDQP